jgi:hypothetical protein
MERRINLQSIAWFADLHRTSRLNLNPSYQRKPEVWSAEYKVYFIDSILKDYPVPAVFLHVETAPDGKTRFNVVDGKQRLTTILDFLADSFALTTPRTKHFALRAEHEDKSFSELSDDAKIAFYQYTLPVQEVVNASETELVEAFDRLNRNVAKLTKQELRHAKFSGEFITQMESLAEDTFWEDFGILSKARSRRMADVEFISEIFLLTMHGIQDGSDALLDEYYSRYDNEIPDWEDNRRRYDNCKELIAEIGSDTLKSTRFKNLGDFYSLWATMLRSIDNKRTPAVRTTRKRLVDFDALLKVQPPTEELALKYSDAVRQGTNKKENRSVRTDILGHILKVS